MWPLPHITQQHTYFAIHHNKIICAWIQKSSLNQRLVLQAYEVIPYTSKIPILSMVTQKIVQFLARHDLKNSSAHISLMPSTLYENCFIFNKASPSFDDFGKPGFKKFQWHYTYLHPLEDGNHHFYFCALNPAELFYYQLLLLSAGLHIARITSSYIAQLNAYRALYHNAFRHCQLATDMARTNYNLEQLFTCDIIARLIYIPSHCSITLEKERATLSSLIGLFYLKESP